MSYASPSDGTLDVDFSTTRPDPFISWLDAHGLLLPGCSWEAAQEADGTPVYRRRASSVGGSWPTNKIAGPLVVRPKRRVLEMT